MRKPVFGVSDQGRLNPVCSANEILEQADLHIDCPPMANAGLLIM